MEDVPANVTFKPRLEFLLGNSIQGSRQTPHSVHGSDALHDLLKGRIVNVFSTKALLTFTITYPNVLCASSVCATPASWETNVVSRESTQGAERCHRL
jgi:hypothetical protein